MNGETNVIVISQRSLKESRYNLRFLTKVLCNLAAL